MSDVSYAVNSENRMRPTLEGCNPSRLFSFSLAIPTHYTSLFSYIPSYVGLQLTRFTLLTQLSLCLPCEHARGLAQRAHRWSTGRETRVLQGRVNLQNANHPGKALHLPPPNLPYHTRTGIRVLYSFAGRRTTCGSIGSRSHPGAQYSCNTSSELFLYEEEHFQRLFCEAWLVLDDVGLRPAPNNHSTSSSHQSKTLSPSRTAIYPSHSLLVLDDAMVLRSCSHRPQLHYHRRTLRTSHP